MIVVDVFTDVMLPLFAVAALGGWVGRRANASVATLSALAFHLFSPALVFDTLTGLDVAGDLLLRIVAVVSLGFAGMALAGVALSAALGYDRARTAGTALCAAVPNNGNMALPLAALAFGAEGLAIAVVVYVTATALTFSAGIVIASLAGGPVRDALAAPLRVPALWTVPPALLLNLTGAGVPVWLDATASTLAGAAIPVMLVALGLQFTHRLPRLADLRESAGVLGLRLLLGPAVAAGATLLLGVGGLAQRTLIVLGGMPTAVVTMIIATEYDVEPGLVSRTVVASTLASLATLTVLVALLR